MRCKVRIKQRTKQYLPEHELNSLIFFGQFNYVSIFHVWWVLPRIVGRLYCST
jgi:hypothetical protein